jgi:uncharacterized Zn-finger protein
MARMNKGNLTGNKPIHEKKPFKCHCGRRFPREDHLTSHEQTHSKARLFKCDDCGKGFKYAKSLKQHKADERCIECEACGNYYSKIRLARHLCLAFELPLHLSQQEEPLHNHATALMEGQCRGEIGPLG